MHTADRRLNAHGKLPQIHRWATGYLSGYTVTQSKGQKRESSSCNPDTSGGPRHLHWTCTAPAPAWVWRSSPFAPGCRALGRATMLSRHLGSRPLPRETADPKEMGPGPSYSLSGSQPTPNHPFPNSALLTPALILGVNSHASASLPGNDPFNTHKAPREKPCPLSCARRRKPRARSCHLCSAGTGAPGP